MKSIAKVLLVGAVAVMAVAISAAPSEAAKKKAMKAAGPAPGTYVGQACSTEGKVMVWGPDMKWSPSIFPVCNAPFCPAAC